MRGAGRAGSTTAAAGLAALALLAACSGSPANDDAGSAEEVSGELVVFAASSLQGVFTDLATTFEQRNPGVEATFSFGSSAALAEQVNAGAPADVLATASAPAMAQAAENVVEPVTFARNTLVIVTSASGQGGVTGLGDFADPDRTLAVCAVEVPCGAAAQEAFAAAGITPSVDTYAENVTAALNLAVSGEVDASLVYATDARGAGDDVVTITFPEGAEAVNDTLVAVTADAPNPGAAAAFVDLVTSPDGATVLEDAGFALP